MNNSLFDYIQKLSLADKKTLSQKALKTCEEVGELAKAVLPYDNAFATTHRFVQKEKVLEEVADTILTSISIAYDLGYSTQDVEDMLVIKCEKWSKLISGEKDLVYPIPYEIHITVPVTSDVVERFKSACKSLGVKPIVLDLQNKNGDVVAGDAMTSSKHFGTNRTAYEEMCRISKGLSEGGWAIVREKIETVPYHPAVPQKDGDVMPPNCYLESHVGVIVYEDSNLELLRNVAKLNDAHLSKNIFKKINDSQSVLMITIRQNSPYDKFMNSLNVLLAHLMALGFQFEEPVVEFSVFDTKLSHDAEWLKG